MKTKPNPNYVSAKSVGVEINLLTGESKAVKIAKPQHAPDVPRYDFMGGKWVLVDARK